MNNEFNNQNNMNNGFNNQNMNNGFNNQNMNNGFNNQNMNNGYNNQNMNNDFSNQNMNNSFNNQNMNNGFNNQNMNNGYNNQNGMNNQPQNGANPAGDKVKEIIDKVKNTKLKYVVIVIAALILIPIIGNLLGGGSGKNTYICEAVENVNDTTAKTTAKITFNDGYQLRTDKTSVITYKSTLTDEKYYQLIKNLGAVQCAHITDDVSDECKGSNLSLGTTSFAAWDTKVVRSGNTVTITGYDLKGKGYTMTSQQIKDSIESTRQQGFTCR